MKTIKKIVALTTGAVMLGATITGAMAADLGNYPGPFVKDCNFDGQIVVGKNAASEDVVGAVDVGTALAISTAVEGETTGGEVAIEGDSWEVKTSGKNLEIGEEVADVTSYITDGDLEALSDGTFSNNKGSFPYEQELRFGEMIVQLDENDDEDVAVFLHIDDDENYMNYTMTFTTDAESDIDSAAELEDIKNKKITIMGKEFTIVKADSINTNTGIELRLMGGAVNDIVEQGQTKTYTIDGKDYEVELTYVGDTDCKFKVNGESSELMGESDTDTVAGIELGVKDIMEEEAGEVQPDQVEFYLGADKVVLKDTDVSDTLSSDKLKVGDETMDEAAVYIEGSNDGSEATIDEIKIVYTADDEFFLGEGDKLSGALEEPRALINFDISNEGLIEESSEMIKINPSNDEQYDLDFTTEAGDISMPLFWNNDSADQIVLGEKTSSRDKVLVLAPNLMNVEKNNYFILTPNETLDMDTRTHVLQYKGADDNETSSPKIKFEDLATGETIERSWDITTHTATLKLGGTDYVIQNASPDSGDDFDINVSTELKSTYDTGLATGYIVTKYGAKITIVDNVSDATDDPYIEITEVESTMLEDMSQEVINFTWDVSESEANDIVSAAENVTLTTTKEDDDVSIYYTGYGAKVTKTEATSSPDDFEVEWPKSQRFAQAFVTSGEVEATIVGGAGELVCKVDVPSAKLDSEISDVTAQNMIIVGGPCINSAAAKVLGVEQSYPACAEGFEEGKAKIKMVDTGSNVALVVAGYSAMDTRRATRVLKNYDDYALSGDEVEVTGTSLTDISVGVPTMMAEETTE